MVERWRDEGVVEEWYRRSTEDSAEHPRWRGKPVMQAVARHLAREVHVLLEKPMVSLRPPSGRLGGRIGERRNRPGPRRVAHRAGAPIAGAAGVWRDRATPGDPNAPRKRFEYGTLPGGRWRYSTVPRAFRRLAASALTDGPIAWIADNQRKGISATPAVTLHATAAFSSQRWDRNREDSARELLGAATAWLGSEVTEFPGSRLAVQKQTPARQRRIRAAS
ncbi:MAG: hypothetical protein MZV65_16545 [Chromatiales bacterium]|nr:hypothetical protein [Chromatiales bacterium]